ncbi:MAG: PorT family protein [Tannerellaceae bacterium]|jgi:hypothetical protein|nr:PorT family protein [Tannerellaceae bacterium]
MGRHLQLILAALLLSLSLAQAQQEAFRYEAAIGASVGMGISTVSFVPTIPQKQLTGYHAGITFRWITENYLGLQAEANLSQQGWSELFDEPQYRYSRRLSYIDIPFLTHIHTKGKRLRFFVNLGPKVGLLIAESTTENVIASPPPAGSQPHRTEQWSMPAQNNFAWGLCGGPGLELRTRIGIFQIEARYYYALGDIFGNRKADTFPKSSSQVIYGKLSYLIRL